MTVRIGSGSIVRAPTTSLPSPRPNPGLCTVRVEPHGNHLVITVASNYFVAQGFRPTESGPSLHCVDTGEALAVVAEFLRRYAPPENE